MSIGITSLVAVILLMGSAGCDILSSGSSDDGFQSEPGPILYIGKETEPYSEYHQKQLYTVGEDGRQNNQLTDFDDYEVVDAAWAPNGEHIVMVRNQINSMSQWAQNLYLVDHQGENGRRLVTSDNDRWGIKSITTPVFSPDASKIAFVGLTNVTNQGQGEHDVYVVNVESGEMRKITNSPGIVEELMSWGGNGQIFATQIWKNTNPVKNQMMSMNEQGETVNAWERFRSHYSRPLLSHDEQFISFMRGSYDEASDGDDDAVEHRVMVMPVDGDPDSARVVTSGNYRSYKPVAWSPDDSQMLVQGITPNTDRQSQEAPLRYHILLADSDGSGVQEITPDREDFYYEPVSWIDPEQIGTSR